MHRADRAHETIAVPERDHVPCQVMRGAADDARRSDAVVGVQPGPGQHLVGGGVASMVRAWSAMFATTLISS